VLILAALLVNVLRNTFSKVVLLLVGLGYGICIRGIERYKSRIASLSFLYVISMAAYKGIFYINHNQPISVPVALIVFLPLSILNSFFCLWIFFAFRRSLRYLKEKQ